jgi:hypothetical protein
MDRLTYSKWQAALQADSEDASGSPLRQKIDDINVRDDSMRRGSTGS